MSSTDSDTEFYDAKAGDEIAGTADGTVDQSGGQDAEQRQQQRLFAAAGAGSRSRRASSADNISVRRRSSAAQTDVPPTPAIPERFLKDSRLGRPASIASPARLPLHDTCTADERNNPPPALGSDEQRTAAGAAAESASPPLQTSRIPGSKARSTSRKRSSTSTGTSTSVGLHPHHHNANAHAHAITSATPNLNLHSAVRNRVHSEKQRPESLPTTPVAQVDVHTLHTLERRAPSQEGRRITTMSRPGRSRNGDLFLQVAVDNDFDDDDDSNMVTDDELAQRLRSSSRTSHAGKRRSLPADILVNNRNDRRPSTSGHLYSRPSSSLYTTRASADPQRHMDQYKSPTDRTTFTFGDNAAVSAQSNSGRSRRYSVLADRSPASPSRLRDRLQSPELPSYGRRRPSFGTAVTPSRTMGSFEEESPAMDSDQRQVDSTSNESQPAESVWDELDDLKSRIKSLEFNGQAPTSSSAAASRDSSDRPRTATTAPTTIDSSPKNVQKSQSDSKKATPTPPATASTTKTIADIHPPLHTALEKARSLLNVSLMRTLDATASDALQLAAITSSAGPQGTNYSAASIINGLTVSDRHVRRKVDNMCRNLTELTLALCEGKHEAPSVVSSPAPIMGNSGLDSPLIRYSPADNPQRSSSVGRPISRLEARKSSILGGNSLAFAENVSPRGSVGDISPGEQEPAQNPAYLQQPRRVSKAPSGVFSSRQRHDDVSGDEDANTSRPPSRAMTDVGALRSKSRIANENRTPVTHRTPSLRDTLTSRTNDAAFERNREISRIPSIGSAGRRRRLFDNESTPPVLEEEAGPSEYHTPSQPRRRITSLGHYSTDHTFRKSELPGRTTSMMQRRQVIVE